MKAFAASSAIAILSLMVLAIVLVMQSSPSPRVASQPAVMPAQSNWSAPELGPEPNAYDPNRWWQPDRQPNCGPDGCN